MKWSINKNELLRHDFIIYVFKNFVIKEKILHMNHNDLKTDHFTRARIKSAIHKKYFWFKMIKDITKYIHIYSDY